MPVRRLASSNTKGGSLQHTGLQPPTPRVAGRRRSCSRRSICCSVSSSRSWWSSTAPTHDPHGPPTTRGIHEAAPHLRGVAASGAWGCSLRCMGLQLLVHGAARGCTGLQGARGAAGVHGAAPHVRSSMAASSGGASGDAASTGCQWALSSSVLKADSRVCSSSTRPLSCSFWTCCL